MKKPQKMNLSSMDIVEEKKERLKEIFPEVFCENKIDFDQLKRVLGEWVETDAERFGLNWPGKADCMKIIQQPSSATLKPVLDESIKFNEAENLFIEGDNLEVLKLLQKSYFGKIKTIYIDPPYNTGKEFIYSDKYGESLKTYLDYTMQTDKSGRKLATNTESDGRYHSNWLSMMYPRLYIARNLLRTDGLIFISIDDREIAHLRQLCDLVFGSENFVTTFLWKKKSTTTNVRGAKVSSLTEYIVCYQRYDNGLNYRVTKEKNRKYSSEDAIGKYRKIIIEKKNEGEYARKTMMFKILGKKPRRGKRWQIGKEKARQLEKKDRFILENGIVKLKVYDFEEGDTRSANNNLLFAHGSTDRATRELNKIMGISGLFDNPKPIELISQLIEYSQSDDRDDIILDFFAGSGATAEAVMRINMQDGGNRKYICVQIPEPTDKKSKAYEAGHKTIADIGKQRIHKVSREIIDKCNDELSLGSRNEGNLGVKVFKLSPSNFRTWENDSRKISNLAQQILDHANNIDTESTSEDILYELLLKTGYSLTTQVERTWLASKEVFLVEKNNMIICLDRELNQDVIDAIADINPQQVIFLDEGFKGNDQLKTNAVQTFKAKAKKDGKEIIFKTI